MTNSSYILPAKLELAPVATLCGRAATGPFSISSDAQSSGSTVTCAKAADRPVRGHRDPEADDMFVKKRNWRRKADG